MEWVTEGGGLCSGMVAGSLSPQVPWVPLLFYPCNRGSVRCRSLHHLPKGCRPSGLNNSAHSVRQTSIYCAVMLHDTSQAETDPIAAHMYPKDFTIDCIINTVLESVPPLYALNGGFAS